MVDWVRSYVVFGGLGCVLAAVGFLLLISKPWPTTWSGIKVWVKEPVPLSGIVCIILSFIFLMAGTLPMLS